MHYDNYVEKIRRFKQDDTLLCATESLWKVWHYENEKLTKKQKHELILVRAYAPRVLCIAAATSNDHRSLSPQLKDILNLSRFHLEIDETISDKDFIASEVEILAKAISGSELAKYNIPENLIHSCVTSLFFQRLVRSQWDSAAYSMRHVFRSWLIYQHLDCRMGGKASKSIRTLFNQDPIDAFRSALCTYFMASDDNNGKKLKGIFDLNKSNVELEIEKKFKIDRETIRQMAANLAREIDTYRKWHDEEVLALPEVYRKYAPLPLYKSPLFPAEEIWTGKPRGTMQNIFLCPSPHILLASLSDLFFRELSANPQLALGVNASIELGYAGEDYLEQTLPVILPNAKITRLQSNNDKTADFIVETEETFFVIETKKCLGGAEAKTIARPIDVVSVWCRLLESYEQCSATIQRDLKTQIDKKPIIALIVVNDTVLGEQGLFDFIAHHAGIHSSLGLNYVEVLSLDQIEQIFKYRSTADVTRSILEKWKTSKENPVPGNFYSLPVTKRDKPYIQLTHLESAFDTVFPGLDNPFLKQIS